MKTDRLLKVIITFSVITTIWVNEAYAYLDPGSGSMALQVIIAVLAGAILWVKLFWGRIKATVINLLGRGKREEKD